MLRFSIVAAAVTAVISLAPVPVVTTAAEAATLTHVPNQNPRVRHKTSTYRCDSQLGHLRRVYEEQLDQVRDADRVWVTPVCMGEDFGMLRSEGNAGALRGRIAGNGAMLEALRGKNFRPEDVVGIRMTGEDTVLLYVHPFHH